MLRGITVVLYEETQIGVDAFNRPIVTENAVNVGNVLVAPMSDDDIINELNLSGRKAIYQLGIPKGDEHDWENKKVSFFGETFRVIGKPTVGIDEMIPLVWNKKAKVEIIE